MEELATALADLAPFRVMSPPEDVTLHGYSGKHLKLTVPNLPVQGSGDHRRFPGCVGEELQSWIAPLLGGAFHGYNGEPGLTEELWILDVDGTRLVIETNWFACLAPPRRGRDAGHPGLHTDRAMTRLVHDRWIAPVRARPRT